MVPPLHCSRFVNNIRRLLTRDQEASTSTSTSARNLPPEAAISLALLCLFW